MLCSAATPFLALWRTDQQGRQCCQLISPVPLRTASLFPQGKQPVLPVDDYAWVAKYQHVAPGMLPYTPPVFRATPYAVDLNQPNMYFGTAVIKE